jgi:hypothetical protein
VFSFSIDPKRSSQMACLNCRKKKRKVRLVQIFLIIRSCYPPCLPIAAVLPCGKFLSAL